jgi:hypothetical protein
LQLDNAGVAQVAIAKTDALLTKHVGERARQIHDEFLLIADEPVAERAKMLLVEAMTDAFTELFPDAPVRDLVDAMQRLQQAGPRRRREGKRGCLLNENIDERKRRAYCGASGLKGLRSCWPGIERRHIFALVLP